MTDFETLYKNMVRFDRLMGMDLTVHEPGRVSYRLEIQEQHLTSPDACHGGVMSAMMDAVLGVAALSWAVSRGNLCSTVEFKLNFLSPGRPGDLLRGDGTVDFTGSKIIVSSGDIIEAQSGRLVAKGMGTFSQYPMSKKAPYFAPSA